MEDAFKKLRNRKALGSDGITSEVFGNISNLGDDIIFRLCIRIWELGIFVWKMVLLYLEATLQKEFSSWLWELSHSPFFLFVHTNVKIKSRAARNNYSGNLYRKLKSTTVCNANIIKRILNQRLSISLVPKRTGFSCCRRNVDQTSNLIFWKSEKFDRKVFICFVIEKSFT